MKINQALKHKNKLVKEVTKLNDKFKKSNTWTEPNVPTYDAKEMFSQLLAKTDELIKHKSKLSVATTPIVEKILRMNELKSFISNTLNVLSCQNGFTTTGYGSSERTVTVVSSINQKQKDELVAKYESEIESLQDEIDTFNATTDI
jgi:hypothetical protein